MLVKQSRDVAIDHAQLLFLSVCFATENCLVFFTEIKDKLSAIRRPFKAAEFTLDIGQRSRFATIERNNVNLGLLFVTPIGNKRNLPAIRRPVGLNINLIPIGELTRPPP